MFLLGASLKNIVNTVMFATRGKKHRKYRGLGLPKRKKTAACTIFFALRVSKNNNPTYVTIFRGPQKCENKMCCKNNKNKNNNNNQKHKNATQRCVTSCGMTRTPYCALHLRARAVLMNNTKAHTTIHNPYGIESVRSSTIRTA